MSRVTLPAWHALRTAETRLVERELRKEFPRTDAYRFNNASIRVRIIDPRFKDRSNSRRVDLVEAVIKRLPQETQQDIMNLQLLTPEEVDATLGRRLVRLEFENPSPPES